MAGRPPEQPAEHSDQPESPATAEGSDDLSVSVEAIARQLRGVVRAGVDRTDPHAYRGLFALRCVQTRARRHAYPDNDDGLAHAARDVIGAALDTLGEGPFGDAARCLFGAHTDTRGRTLRERRRVAAYRLDVLPTHFRRRYEPEIVRGVADEVFRAEHTPPPDQEHAAPHNTTVGPRTAITPAEHGTQQGEDSPAARRSRWRRMIGALRPPRRDDDEGAPVVLASPSTPHAFTDAQPRSLGRALRELEDWRARREWYLIFVVAGAIVFARYGSDAIPRYLLVLAILGLARTAADIATAAAAKKAALYENWPRILLLVCTVILSGGIVTRQGDNSDRPPSRPCLFSDCGPSTTDTTFPVPSSVPVTYAQPTEPVEPECPPPDNPTRQLTFTEPPPRCINPDATYIATVATNYGDFDITLNTSEAPTAVNNFVFLARWHHYDGVTLTPFPQPTALSPADYLVSGEPVEAPHTLQVPGYSLESEPHEGGYPHTPDISVVVPNPDSPDLFGVVISPRADDEVEAQQGAWPLLGHVTRCRDLLYDNGTDGRIPRDPSSHMVIDTITIAEHPTPPTTTTDYQDHCREEHAAAQ